MSREPIQRIEDDLATMKAALGMELPYDYSHAAMCFLGAGLGALLCALTLLGLELYTRPALGGYIVLMFAAWVTQIRHLRARRTEAPALWRWGRKEAVASVTAIALLVGYVVWAAAMGRMQGRWSLREALSMASPLFFCLGAAGCVWVTVETHRWPILGTAVALLILGLLIPLCESREQFYLLAGVIVLAGGTSSGLLLLWQLRRHGVDHAH